MIEIDETLRRQYIAGARAIGLIGALLTVRGGLPEAHVESARKIVDEWESADKEPSHASR